MLHWIGLVNSGSHDPINLHLLLDNHADQARVCLHDSIGSLFLAVVMMTAIQSMMPSLWCLGFSPWYLCYDKFSTRFMFYFFVIMCIQYINTCINKPLLHFQFVFSVGSSWTCWYSNWHIIKICCRKRSWKQGSDCLKCEKMITRMHASCWRNT